MPTPPKTGRKVGSPTKKNDAIIERLIATARLGLPYAIVAQRAGITRETLTQWRHLDPDLDRRLDEARAEAAEKAWLKIMAHGESDSPNAWQSIAWRLERSHPESFARPEIQLAAVQSNFTTNNTLSISFELAKNLEARSAPVRRKIEQLFANHTSGSSFKQLEEASGDERLAAAAVAEMKFPALQMPAGKLTHQWWSQLVRGDNTREVERETAAKICRVILEDVFGKQRAQSTSVEFAGNSILLRDVHAELESLCGVRGWEALTKRGEARK